MSIQMDNGEMIGTSIIDEQHQREKRIIEDMIGIGINIDIDNDNNIGNDIE